MPGPWTPAHRAAYEATIEAKRAAAEGQHEYVPPQSTRRRVTVSDADAVVAATVARTQFEAAMAGVLELLMGNHEEAVAAIKGLAASVNNRDANDLAERMRATALRIEDALKLAREPMVMVQRPDAQMLQAMRTLATRLAGVESGLAERNVRDDQMLQLLRRIDSRPARVIEFRPTHTREAEGGTTVRSQRAAAGMTKRARGHQTLISPMTGKSRKSRSDAGVPKAHRGVG